LSAVQDSLFNIFTATLHFGGCSYIHNLEDVPWRGDRDPHILAILHTTMGLLLEVIQKMYCQYA